MSDAAGVPGLMTRLAHTPAPRLAPIVAAGVALLGLSSFFLDQLVGLAALGAGVSLLLLAALLAVVNTRTGASQNVRDRVAAQMAQHDPAPTFVTDNTGLIRYANPAADQGFSTSSSRLDQALDPLFASAAGTIKRMSLRAISDGAAQQDIASSEGSLRLTVHRIEAGGLLWRIEEQSKAAVPASGEETQLPMMRIGKPHKILEMNEAMRVFLGGQPVALDRVVSRLPLQSGEPTVLQTAEGSKEAHLAIIDIGRGEQLVYIWPEVAPAVDQASADSIPVPLMRVSPSGSILLANARARKLLALSNRDDLDFPEVIEGLGRPIDEWLLDVSEGRGTGRTEVVRAALPAQDVFLQVSLGRMVERGEVSILVVLIDATELKTLEAQFVQSQKMQAIGQLAGGVAHDFNNLLTAISGHCDLLLLRHEPGDPNYADLIQINQNANRAASLVGQLLAFSRKQNLQPEMIDLRETLVDLTHLLNRLVGEKINLRWSHDPDLPRVRADKRQLEQVIMNLVVNARDAMPGGGTIHVETTTEVLREALQRDRAEIPPGSYVIVKVLDEGCGIASDKLQKIFEPFYSTKKTGEGTGLGLSMAYGIVKQSGGFIFADSVVGKGSSFTMYFPAHRDAEIIPARVEDASSKTIAPQQGGHVLLVEDEAPVRAFASRALRLRGYTVTEAACAEDALELLDDPELSVDVFVTDVVMPGMDGPTWVATALEKRPGVKVVFVSGYAEDNVSHNRSKIPNSSFLPKPFSLNQLTQTVQAQLS